MRASTFVSRFAHVSLLRGPMFVALYFIYSNVARAFVLTFIELLDMSSVRLLS